MSKVFLDDQDPGLFIYACGPKTVPVKRTFLNIAIVGWSGVGWGGMLTFLVLRTWYIAMLLRSLGSFTTLHVATLLMGWGGSGVWWGGMLTFLVLRAWYIAMLLRSLGSFTTLHMLMWWGGVGWGGHVNVPGTSYMIYCYAAEISGIVYYVTCCDAAEISGIVYYVTCCYAAEISGIVYYVTCCYAAEISGIVYYVTCCYAAEISGIVYYVTIFYMESDEKVNSQQLGCQKWPLDGVC